jgi:hypothetical protein
MQNISEQDCAKFKLVRRFDTGDVESEMRILCGEEKEDFLGELRESKE